MDKVQETALRSFMDKERLILSLPTRVFCPFIHVFPRPQLQRRCKKSSLHTLLCGDDSCFQSGNISAAFIQRT